MVLKIGPKWYCFARYALNRQSSLADFIDYLVCKHHNKKLVPIGEALHKSIPIILAYIVVKLSPVQKSSKLSKNIFVLVHIQFFVFLHTKRFIIRFILKYT